MPLLLFLQIVSPLPLAQFDLLSNEAARASIDGHIVIEQHTVEEGKVSTNTLYQLTKKLHTLVTSTVPIKHYTPAMEARCATCLIFFILFLQVIVLCLTSSSIQTFLLTLFLFQIKDVAARFAKQDGIASLFVQLKATKEECAQVHELYCGKENELNQLQVTKDEKRLYLPKRHTNSRISFAKQGVKLSCTRKCTRKQT